MGGLCCFFRKSTSICDYIHFYDLDLLLTTLTTRFRKTTLKMDYLETTLTTLIYIKNSFITDYADNDDIQDNMKNSFITKSLFNTRWEMTSLQDYIKNNFIIDCAYYTDLQDYVKIILSLTTLTTPIIKITWKTAFSLI